jgi:hypothetical protein
MPEDDHDHANPDDEHNQADADANADDATPTR